MVDVGGVKHFEDVVVVDSVLDLLGNALELLEVDDSVLILIVQGVESLESVLGFGLSDFGSDDINEFVESDGFVFFFKSVDKDEDEGIPFVET